MKKPTNDSEQLNLLSENEDNRHPELTSRHSERSEESVSLGDSSAMPQNDIEGNLTPTFTVSDAVALFNQIFETATPTITVVGEVANFKVNQGKWVFFDLKDDESSLGCFMSLFNLRVAVEDGMQVAVTARPTLTKWGKFSLTVQSIRPVGAGSIKRAFELLRAKLDAEGLFAPERKRALPAWPSRIGVISSVDAAGYQDFIKILGQRFGGLEIVVAPVQVQGEPAVEQIMAALKFFNETGGTTTCHPEPGFDPGEGSPANLERDSSQNQSAQNNIRNKAVDVIAILRGGGSRDDLVAFDDEALVRAVAASRIPTIAGIGHEIDTTLTDLAADVRASTPSNAAEILVPDKREVMARVDFLLQNLWDETEEKLERTGENLTQKLRDIGTRTENIWARDEQKFQLLNTTLTTLDPRAILRHGYAIVRDETGKTICTKPRQNAILNIETWQYLIESEVKNVREKC